MEIRNLPAFTPGPQGLDALAATAAPAPASPQPGSTVLDPPVKFDLGSSGRDAYFVRDRDTHALVFEVIDTGSGEVIAQLPSETALRNRAYDEAVRVRATQAGRVSQVA